MDTNSIQALFFQHIKSALPPHLSLVNEVADLLKISNDSAYRRIRGEKPIMLEEMQVLATHYKISLDQFLQLPSDSFIFSGKLTNATDHVYENWLESMLQQLQFINSFPKKHLYYLAKDIPLMQLVLVPELIAFKSFLWRKSILLYEEMKGQKFSLRNVNPLHIELGNKIAEVCNRIPSTEIWNIESINSTIRQIEFYREAHIFESEEDVVQLYKAIGRLIDHMEKQAERGVRFLIGEEPKANAAPFNLLNNELQLGDNTVLVELGSTKITYLNHSVINFIATRDERFNAYMFDTLQNLIKKSTLLSNVGEKERIRFFNRLRDKTKLAARL